MVISEGKYQTSLRDRRSRLLLPAAQKQETHRRNSSSILLPQIGFYQIKQHLGFCDFFSRWVVDVIVLSDQCDCCLLRAQRMNPDCKWKQEEFRYIYYLRALSRFRRAWKDKNPKEGRAFQARAGIWNHCALGFQLPTKTLITRFVNKYPILASSDSASNASTLGISNPDPLPEHNNTYPNLLELTRRSYFILFYF